MVLIYVVLLVLLLKDIQKKKIWRLWITEVWSATQHGFNIVSLVVCKEVCIVDCLSLWRPIFWMYIAYLETVKSKNWENCNSPKKAVFKSNAKKKHLYCWYSKKQSVLYSSVFGSLRTFPEAAVIFLPTADFEGRYTSFFKGSLQHIISIFVVVLQVLIYRCYKVKWFHILFDFSKHLSAFSLSCNFF